MAEVPQFLPGDVVIHPRRREWGHGVVERAQQIAHQGKAGQRLVVAFANHGRTVINTAVAPLLLKDTTEQMSSSTSRRPSHRGWLDTLAESNGRSEPELSALPEAMTDPFASIGARLLATLDSYRYSTEARLLLDWAVAQTGLDDPLTKYTRHELEEAFPRFARTRDRHLRELVRQLKAEGKIELLNETIARTHNAAASASLQAALRR